MEKLMRARGSEQYLNDLYRVLGERDGKEFRQYVRDIISKRHHISSDDWKRKYTEEQFSELILLYPDLEQLSWQVYETTTDLICTKLASYLLKSISP